MKSFALVLLTGCGFIGHGQGNDTPVDAAPMIDAPACPATYKKTGGSYYRIITVASYAWAAGNDCIDDRPGRTHLAAIDDAQEMGALESLIETDRSNPTYWVGGIQRPTATATSSDWLSITGGDLPPIWRLPNPDDGNGNENQHAQQFPAIGVDGYGFIDDADNLNAHGAICECDGKPLDVIAQQLIDQQHH